MIHREFHTPPQIAKLLGVQSNKVREWILAGELAAIDGSARRNERPRYLVRESDLQKFLASRAVVPAKGGSK